MEDHVVIKSLNIIEASKLLGIHKETTRRLVASGEIPGVKIGRSWRFIQSDLLAYMRSLYIKPNEIHINNRNNKEWLSSKEMPSGGSTLHTREKEYAKALGLR